AQKRRWCRPGPARTRRQEEPASDASPVTWRRLSPRGTGQVSHSAPHTQPRRAGAVRSCRLLGVGARPPQRKYAHWGDLTINEANANHRYQLAPVTGRFDWAPPAVTRVFELRAVVFRHLPQRVESRDGNSPGRERSCWSVLG